MQPIKLVWVTQIKKIVLNARSNSEAVDKILLYCEQEEFEINDRWIEKQNNSQTNDRETSSKVSLSKITEVKPNGKTKLTSVRKF